jgi:Zn/Cd-binding protein ZinT
MGKVKALIGLVVILGGFYVAWNMVPPYFNNYQFQDGLDDIARKNTYTTISDDDLKKIVVTKADTEDIKLKEDQVTVTRKVDGLGISVKYKVHVDMVVHPVDLEFTANSLNKRI